MWPGVDKMYTIFAYEKSEYCVALSNFINLKLSHKERYENYKRIKELEEIIKKEGDEIQIIITTKNTPRPLVTAPPMENKE